MDENIIKKKSIKILRTINDLEEDEYLSYREEYYNTNKELIKKYLNLFDTVQLKQNFWGRTFFHMSDLADDKDVFWVSSSLKYGMKNVFVPIDFYTLTETVLTLDCRVRGIFRVRNSMITVKECVNMLEVELKNRTSFKDIRNKLAENFNVIDLTTAFKEITRNYKTTVIPENCLKIIFKCFDTKDKAERLILYHYLYISLPKFNRHILEATIYFLYLIHDLATNGGKEYENNMNMEGISTVMMPNLILKENNNVSLDQVPLLVEFMVEFIANFPNITKQNPTF
ncbi:Rho-GTPase-activating protein LRG1 [Nosema granulosis]|uniref:Rho-GTPase-activating protein LRG1 n=1 Tax=Nosema granulosis TaxID=83296 RepID=A0A9P6GWR5_9MICR|nr:Rho-GTPase-activating protein LRG1 [Nosema granulosis]